MSTTRFVVIATVITAIVSIADSIVFFKIKNNPGIISASFVVMVILVTVIPIIVSLLCWLRR